MVEQSDPSRKVFESVAQWNNTVTCLPTWHELIEFEYIRQRGELNMLGTTSVQRYAYDRGLYHCVNWLQRCIEAKISVTQLYSQGVSHYEKTHGDRETWITAKLKTAWLKNEHNMREDELKRQLRELKKKRVR